MYTQWDVVFSYIHITYRAHTHQIPPHTFTSHTTHARLHTAHPSTHVFTSHTHTHTSPYPTIPHTQTYTHTYTHDSIPPPYHTHAHTHTHTHTHTHHTHTHTHTLHAPPPTPPHTVWQVRSYWPSVAAWSRRTRNWGSRSHRGGLPSWRQRLHCRRNSTKRSRKLRTVCGCLIPKSFWPPAIIAGTLTSTWKWGNGRG